MLLLYIYNSMLDDLDSDLADAQANMDITRRYLSKFLKTKDTFQMTMILALVAITVLLVILVIFT